MPYRVCPYLPGEICCRLSPRKVFVMPPDQSLLAPHAPRPLWCRGAWLLCWTLLLAAPPALGQMVYVTDRIVANLYPIPVAGSRPVDRLPTGTPLEQLEKRGEFVRVRSREGTEGWMLRRHLMVDEPAQVLLLRLSEENRRLRTEVADQRREEPLQPARYTGWGALLTVTGLVVGFFLGMRYLDWRFRTRHGGMRV